MGSDFEIKISETVEITGNVASATRFIPGTDGEGRLLIEARIFPTGTFDSGTLTVTILDTDGSTQIQPPDAAAAVTFTSAPSSGTQVVERTTSTGPFDGVYYTYTGGGGSTDVELNWSATYG